MKYGTLKIASLLLVALGGCVATAPSRNADAGAKVQAESSATAPTEVRRLCRTVRVKTKGEEDTQRYCRNDDGEWQLVTVEAASTPNQKGQAKPKVLPSAIASAGKQRPCRTVRTKAEGKEFTKCFCENDDGKWVAEAETVCASNRKGEAAPVAAPLPAPEPQRMSRMADGREVYVSMDVYIGTYKGETILEDGILKAHGKGVAQGNYRYEGGFQQGKLHGYGVASWTKEDRSIAGNKIDDFSKYLGNIREENGRYILSGWFEDNGLLFHCDTEMDREACRLENAKKNMGTAVKVAKGMRDRMRQSRPYIEDSGADPRQACAGLYAGKAVSYQKCKTTLILRRKKCENFRGVITGMNANTGDVTVMIRENYDYYRNGQLINLSCSSVH